MCWIPTLGKEKTNSRSRSARTKLPIRMVAGFAEVIEGKDFLVAGAGFEPTTSAL